MQQAIPYNIQILSWAVARAGYNVQEFAEKYPGIDLLKWMQKEKQPTLKQLENFSKKVNVPFGYLFLQEPPKENIPFPFFRTGDKAKQTISPDVYDTILTIQRRQDWLRDYLIEVEQVEPLPFVGKFSLETPVDTIVTDIRKTLSLKESWSTEYLTKDAALDFLVKKIEDIRIVVVLNGIVGNNTRRSLKNEQRAFVLVDKYVPFIFVNKSAATASHLFTIVHELAHIWIGQSAGFELTHLLPADDPIELICNAVAAELLIPKKLFKDKYHQGKNFIELSNYFKVSTLIIARRALDLKFIDLQNYLDYFKKQLEAKHNESPENSGGYFYKIANERISRLFARYIDRAVKSGKLLYRDAYRLTGLTSKTYSTFIENLL